MRIYQNLVTTVDTYIFWMTDLLTLIPQTKNTPALMKQRINVIHTYLKKRFVSGFITKIITSVNDKRSIQIYWRSTKLLFFWAIVVHLKKTSLCKFIISCIRKCTEMSESIFKIVEWYSKKLLRMSICAYISYENNYTQFVPTIHLLFS